MKIKQEIIEAKYDILELTAEEYEIIKSALNEAKGKISAAAYRDAQPIKGTQLTQYEGYDKLLDQLK